MRDVSNPFARNRAEVYVVTSVDTVKASKPIYKIKLAQPQARQLPGWVHKYQLIEATD